MSMGMFGGPRRGALGTESETPRSTADELVARRDLFGEAAGDLKLTIGRLPCDMSA